MMGREVRPSSWACDDAVCLPRATTPAPAPRPRVQCSAGHVVSEQKLREHTQSASTLHGFLSAVSPKVTFPDGLQWPDRVGSLF